jgi:transcriptional regulator with XRE-family HTH domain
MTLTEGAKGQIMDDVSDIPSTTAMEDLRSDIETSSSSMSAGNAPDDAGDLEELISAALTLGRPSKGIAADIDAMFSRSSIPDEQRERLTQALSEKLEERADRLHVLQVILNRRRERERISMEDMASRLQVSTSKQVAARTLREVESGEVSIQDVDPLLLAAWALQLRLDRALLSAAAQAAVEREDFRDLEFAAAHAAKGNEVGGESHPHVLLILEHFDRLSMSAET